jgi:hypothetical protein
MKRILLGVCILFVISFAVNAQTTQTAQTGQADQIDETNLFVGINSGIDYNINAFSETNGYYNNKYYGIKPQYNIGLDFSVMVSKKFRPRLEFKFVSVKYGMLWNGTQFAGTDPKDWTRTLVYVKNYDFNLHGDYLLVDMNKFQLFVSPAFKYEFAAGYKMSTRRVDGTKTSTHYKDIIASHPSSIIGGAVSMIFKYNFTKRVGLTLTPEYTVFDHGFATGNNSLYQRFSTNMGFEFKF